MSHDARFEAVKVEQAAFDELLPEMLSAHSDEFVVFHGGVPVGYFPTYDDAYRSALEMYGSDGVFLVAQVRPPGHQAVSLSWDLGLMFGESG